MRRSREETIEIFRDVSRSSESIKETIEKDRVSSVVGLPMRDRNNKEIGREVYLEKINRGLDIRLMAIELGTSIFNVYRDLRKEGLLEQYREIRERIKEDKYSDLEFLILEGTLSLSDLAEIYGVTRERIRQVLNYRGLHEQFLERRKENKKKRKMEESKKERSKNENLRMLVRAIYSLALKKANEVEDVVERTALVQSLRYIHEIRKRRHIKFEKVYRWLLRYYEAKYEGRKISLRNIAMSDNCMSPQRVLLAIGEKPMYGTRVRKVLSKEKREIVKKAIMIETPFSYEDLGEILGIHPWIFVNWQIQLGIKRKKRKPLNGKINYRTALNLIGALDVGFSKEEAMEYAGVRSQKYFDWIINNRDKILKEVEDFLNAIGFSNEKKREIFEKFGINYERLKTNL